MEKARDIYIKVKGNNHSYTAQAHTNVGYVQHRMGKNEDALNSFKTALGVVEEVKGEENNEEAKANAYTNIGMVLESMQELDGSIFHHTIALGMLKKLYGKYSPAVAKSHHSIGSVLLAKCDYDKALFELEQAKTIFEMTLGSEYDDTIAVVADIEKCENQKYEDKLQ